jgi:hypothetical protein
MVVRSHYLPSCPPETQGEAFAYAVEGRMLDPAEYAAAEEPKPSADAPKTTRAKTTGGDYGDGLRISREKMVRYGSVLEAYNARADVHEILTPHAWTFVKQQSGEELWRRPGKSDDHSATFGYGGGRHFVCFTDSAPPLTKAAYSLFDLTCVLNYGGDVDACARALAAQGYGTLPPEPDAAAPTETPIDSAEPDEDGVPPEPLLNYIRASDRKLAQRRKSGVSPKNAGVKREMERVSTLVPADMVEDVVNQIYIGKAIRQREDAKARDTVFQWGQWYTEVQERYRQHDAKPVIVAGIFGLPLTHKDEYGRQCTHPMVKRQMAELQSYAHIYKTFDKASAGIDAPPKLFKELVSLPDRNRRAFYLQEWSEGRGVAIYSRIRTEKRQASKERERTKTCAHIHDRSRECAPVFDPATGEVLDAAPEASVTRVLSAELDTMLDLLEQRAAQEGVTAAALLARFLVCDDEQLKHAPAHVFDESESGENAEIPISETPQKHAPAHVFDDENGDEHAPFVAVVNAVNVSTKVDTLPDDPPPVPPTLCGHCAVRPVSAYHSSRCSTCCPPERALSCLPDGVPPSPELLRALGREVAAP